MARAYTNAVADVTAVFPGDVYTPIDVRNEDLNGYDVTNETFDVPSEADGDGKYRMELDFVPIEQTTLTITADGDPLTVIPWGETPAADEVALSLETGAVEFHADRAGETVVASYRGRGTNLTSQVLNQMQREIEAVQVGAGGMITGPGPLTDNGIPRMHGTDGKTLQDSPGMSYTDGRQLIITGANGTSTSILGNGSLQFQQVWDEDGLPGGSSEGYVFTMTRHDESKDIFQIVGGAGSQAGKHRWGPGDEESIDVELYRVGDPGDATLECSTRLSGTQLISRVTTGTPPLVVASTTNVPNLNASSLNGATFAAPGAIGSGTPGAGIFTTLDTTGNTTLGGTLTAASLTAGITPTAIVARNASNVVGTITTIPASLIDSAIARMTDVTAAISDTAYNAGTWDGVTDVAPSKNAVRDKFESVATDIAAKADDSAVVKLAGTQTVTGAKTFTGGLKSQADIWHWESAALNTFLRSGAVANDEESVDFPDGSVAVKPMRLVPGTVLTGIAVHFEDNDEESDLTIQLLSRAGGDAAFAVVDNFVFEDIGARDIYDYTLASPVTIAANTEYAIRASVANGDGTLYQIGWQTSVRAY